MLAPISWLKDFVDIDITPEQLQQKLFSCGFEVDQIIEVGKDITGVYVGFVEECEKIEGTHLSKCVVNVGDKGTFQICCGADNVRKGKKFPVALEGATVYSHDKNNPDKKELFTIKNTKIRGVESFGMLCAGDELGVSENMYKGAGYNGLLELSDDAVVGQDFKKAIDLVDYVLEIEIPASRPDCQSIFGIAREVAAVLGKPFKMPKTNFDEIQKEINFEVEVKDFDLCPRYMAHYVSGVKVEQAPQWMRKRLELVGVNSINNIVDITNYVLKEIGQPLHSFDKALLNNNKLVVRRARENEEFKALNDQTYTLNTNNLVIADGEKAVALAGVMGGANSGINQDTKEVMFESATFERSSVRKTSRALGLASDSSARFEKGVDEFSTVLGLNRALSLVQELNAGQITNVRFVKAKNPEIKEKYLAVSINKINELLGIEIPQSEYERILSILNFQPQIKGDALTVVVPAYRTDVESYQDIAEEVIRMYGYENIKPTSIETASLTVGGRSEGQKLKLEIKKNLMSQGFYESINYSFFSPKDLDLIKAEENSPLRNAIKLVNPLKETISIMRTCLAPSMIQAVVRNLKRQNKEGRLFEISKIFIPKTLPLTEYPIEKDMLCLGVFGAEETFFTVKGALETLANRFGFEFEFEAGVKPFLHPGITAIIKLNGEEIGYTGLLSHELQEELSVDKPVFIAELDYEKIAMSAKAKVSYKNIAGTVIVNRDLAIVADEKLLNGQIEKVIKAACPSLTAVELFDIYKGQQVEKDKMSLAYSLTMEIEDNDKAEEVVNKNIHDILLALNKELNIFIRQ